jgi:CMP/dCMP kinase
LSKPLNVIAIDGPAGSGKSTTAKAVAKKLKWQYLDTGAMYRALALAVIRDGGDTEIEGDVRPVLDKTEITLEPGEPTRVFINGEEVSLLIRSAEVSQGASKVSVHGFVRNYMVKAQQKIGLMAPCVLEGRDTTTIVFPDAGLKIYLNATVEERASRRLKDYTAQGNSDSLERVISEIKIRDNRDSSRKEGPLKISNDATVVDTSDMTIDEQITRILSLAEEIFGLEIKN